MNSELQKSKESRFRSILKALSWRVIATLTTAVIVYVVIGEIEAAVLIGSVEAIVKIGVYYAHERLWQFVPRGSIRSLLGRR